MQQAKFILEHSNSQQHDRRKNEPSLQSLPSNAPDDDPDHQCEREQSNKQGGNFKLAATRCGIRAKNSSFSIAYEIMYTRVSPAAARGSHFGRCRPNHTHHTITQPAYASGPRKTCVISKSARMLRCLVQTSKADNPE